MSDKSKNPDWFRVKKYLHFDTPIDESSIAKIEKLVSNSEWVSKYPFYPFITYKIKKYKYKKDEATGKRHIDSKGFRPIAYAAHLDSIIYSYYSKQLSDLYEKKLKEHSLDETVIAFRKLKDSNGDSKSNVHMARDAFNKIKEIKNCKVYAFDIKSFFDTLDAKYLKQAWKKILEKDSLPEDHMNIYKSMVRHASVDKNELFKLLGLAKKTCIADQKRVCEPLDFRSKVRGDLDSIRIDETTTKKGLIVTKTLGIPQGSPISALLANIYMLDFDIYFSQLMESEKGFYYRYCDDIMCILPKTSELKLESLIELKLKEIHLTPNSAKTEKATYNLEEEIKCDRAIQYLGFVFNGKTIAIRNSSIAKYRRNLLKGIASAKKSQQLENIKREKKGQTLAPLYKKKLYNKFLHTGKRNFIRYGLRAAEVMQSQTIKRQMKKMHKMLKLELGL